jgi:methyl-accepting chemotaxis protein
MNIRKKLILGGALVGLLPIVVATVTLGVSAYSSAKNSLAAESEAKLTVVRENKKAQIEDYFNRLAGEVSALAQTQAVIGALKDFKVAHRQIVAESGNQARLEEMRAALIQYYTGDFVGEFKKRNPGDAPDMAAYVNRLDPVALTMQYQYIIQNANPLGQKDKLDAASDPSTYSKAHSVHHPGFHALQQKLGLYDVFLVDGEANRVVYTVFKELDFGTTFDDGIAAKSKLGEVVARALNSPEGQTVAMSDYDIYLPSYYDQASFLAVPVFEGGRRIGVLAVQIPIDKVTAVLTSGKKWRDVGLGATGESYLVGPDFLMRTDSRYLIENKASYLQGFAGWGGTSQQLQIAQKKNTSIGLQKVDTESVRAALAGQTGLKTYKDYRGVDVVGAYAPFNVLGLNWALVAETDAAEVLAPITHLARQFLVIGVGLALVLLAATAGAVVWFVRKFMRPVNALQDTVQKVSSGDYTARARVQSGDELETLGSALDNLLDDRIAALAKAQEENEKLNDSVIQLLQTVAALSQRDLTARAPVTEDIIGTVADSVNQLSDETGRVLNEVTRIARIVDHASQRVKGQSDAVNTMAENERKSVGRMQEQLEFATRTMSQVAQLAANTNTAAADAAVTTKTALLTVEKTVRGMTGIRDTISEMEKRIKRLGERSQEISSIVGLINTISERTHVLALNAAMQAATAGDAGRGFAVVAEEVQRLAENARGAAMDISNLIQNVRIETNDAVLTVNRIIDLVVQGSETALTSGEQMRLTQETTGRLVELVNQIAQQAENQTRTAEELQRGMTDISNSTQQTADQLQAQSQVTETLLTSARRLVQSVSVFKLPKAA